MIGHERCLKEIVIDPVIFLERVGINNFSVDWERREITLPPNEFWRVVEILLDKPPVAACTAVEYYGWRWVLENQLLHT